VNTGGDHPAMRAMAESVHRQVGKRRVEQPAHPNVVVHPGHVEVTWPDGFAARIPNKELRAACRCAHCVDEHTGAQILDVNSIAETIQVEAVQPLGNYAVSLGWSDGHTTGIYAWDYLRRIAESVGAM